MNIPMLRLPPLVMAVLGVVLAVGPVLAAESDELEEIAIPAEKARDWQVEADFVNAIRTGVPLELTTFATGVLYMEFTEAVARSAEQGEAVELPLEEFEDET